EGPFFARPFDRLPRTRVRILVGLREELAIFVLEAGARRALVYVGAAPAAGADPSRPHLPEAARLVPLRARSSEPEFSVLRHARPFVATTAEHRRLRFVLLRGLRAELGEMRP